MSYFDIDIPLTNQYFYSNSTSNDVTFTVNQTNPANPARIMMGTTSNINTPATLIINSNNVYVTDTLTVPYVTSCNVVASNINFTGNMYSSIGSNLITIGPGDSAPGTYQIPPGPMKSSNTSLSGYTYGNGAYIISSSSMYAVGYEPNKAFDGSSLISRYVCTSNLYSTGGVYTGSNSTTIDGTAYNGEWLQIILPSNQIVTSLSLFSDSVN